MEDDTSDDEINASALGDESFMRKEADDCAVEVEEQVFTVPDKIVNNNQIEAHSKSENGCCLDGPEIEADATVGEIGGVENKTGSEIALCDDDDDDDDEQTCGVEFMNFVMEEGVTPKRKEQVSRHLDNVSLDHGNHGKLSDCSDVSNPDIELSKTEMLADCACSADNREKVFIRFPQGCSYDLRDESSHASVVEMTSSLIKQMDQFKKALSMKETDILQKSETISKLKAQVNEISEKREHVEGLVCSLTGELEETRSLLKSHDASARVAISRLQTENEQRVKILHGKCSTMQKEKELSVMNFARREKELLDTKATSELADKRAKEAFREREKAIVQMKGLKMDLAKLKSIADKKESEVLQFKRDAEKWKEEANSHVIKVRWAQNKLKSETDQHNETKEKLVKAMAEIKRAKEETEQIRKNCQGMIKTYQESEEMRSNSLDSQLKEKEMLLSRQTARSGELQEIHKQQLEELRKLKQKHKDTLEENVVMKTRVECLEKERVENEDKLKGYSELLNKQKLEAALTTDQLKLLEDVRNELSSKYEDVTKLQEELHQLQETIDQMKKKEESWKVKEHDLLEFTQKVSSKNALLASESENLTLRLNEVITELTNTRTLSSDLEMELQALKAQLESQNRRSTDTSVELKKRLQDKETTVNHLTLQLEETKDEIRTIKRKNNANVKDLMKQLQQARKRLEPYESSTLSSITGHATEDGSMGSRASSDTSLECVGKPNNASNGAMVSHNSAAESGSLSNNSINGSAEVPETMVTSTGEISIQTLIERIVRLQRVHARKNEKIDFLHDHVQQLVDEIQKKNKVIQHYMLREESGMLMPETGSGHGTATDQGNKMSRHLSMEINRKLQSVLEDTLLKNIALKESVDALGKEIARLSTKTKT